MADAQQTIDLIFNGIDKTGAATMAALGNAQKFSSSLQSGTAPIADFTIGAVKLEAGLLAAGLAMTVFAVKTAGDFDASFRQISTIIDASAEDLDGFKAAILDYAQGSTQPLDQITTALGNAIGSGVDWADSLSLIATAEKLAVATRSDLDGTTKVLVSTLNSYGMGINEAGALSDLFFKIIDEGDITMTDLAGSFAKVAPIAKISGVSLQEVGAAIATLTASGIKPAESIEYLRGAISNIISPTKQGSDLASELGINFNAAGLKAQGLAGLLGEVALKTGGSADKMKLLFGDIGGFTAAATLAGPQAEKFNETLKAMGDVAGATDAAVAKVAGNLQDAGAKINSAFTAMLVSMGTPLLDEFGGIANAIAAIFTALGDGAKTGGLKDLSDYIGTVFGDIQSALETVATNLPSALASADFSGFKEGIDAVVNAMKSLFGEIDITSVNGLKDAIELAGVAFLGLSRYTAGVIEAFEPLFNMLVDVGRGAEDADLSFLELAGNLGGIATQLDLVLPLFTGLLTLLTAKAGLGLITDLRALPAILGASSGAALTLAESLGKAGLVGAAGAAGYAVGTVLNEGISALLTKITGSDTTLGGFIYDLVNGAEEAEKLGVSTAGAAGGVKELNTAASDTSDSFEKSNQAMLDNFAASEKAATGTGKLAKAQEESNTYAMKTVPILDELTGKIIGYEQQLVKSAEGTIKLGSASDKAGTGLSKIAAETDKAKEATRKWNEEVAKMAFQEKIALIESQTKISTARIEADAKIMVAAFDGVANTITSTGDVLKGLQSQMSGFDNISFSTQYKIEAQIAKENQRRDDAFKLQKDLTEAQISQMKAQTEAMLKGDGMIKIDGAGLAPHLEAFMWEILKAIQVKVNKDGLKMLLGA